MGRPITLFTAQFSDMPFDDLCKLAQKCGYDGLEVATFGGYLDIEKAAVDTAYCNALKAKMAQYGLKLWAISNHFALYLCRYRDSFISQPPNGPELT